MRAFVLGAIGHPPELTDVPDPAPGPGEIGVKIAACGLNFADLLVSQGKYQERPALPAILGMELSGTVETLGPDVSRVAVGDRVAIYSGGRGLAERGVFAASDAVTLPPEMPFEDAAGFLIAYGTSHVALAHKAHLRPGETLLVLGAAGGVGLTAVEIGKVMGARVIACARGADKLDAARRAGADHLIDSETQDIRDTVKDLGGADVVYDPVGGDQFTSALRATRPDGRILAIGFASGTVPQIPANHLLVKNVSVHGLYWGAYARFAPEVLTDSLATLFGWYAERRLKPHVSHVLPLQRTAEGLELLRSRKATGKVVITP